MLLGSASWIQVSKQFTKQGTDFILQEYSRKSVKRNTKLRSVTRSLNSDVPQSRVPLLEGLLDPLPAPRGLYSGALLAHGRKEEGTLTSGLEKE